MTWKGKEASLCRVGRSGRTPDTLELPQGHWEHLVIGGCLTLGDYAKELTLAMS